MKKFFEETILEGRIVKLIPIRLDHSADLISAASDGELWNLWYTYVPNRENIDAYLEKAIKDYENDQGLAFTVIDKKTSKIIGTTRYTNASGEDRRLEIGYTWYSKAYQKSGVNTECKYLLLTHAFETLNCIAVEFQTHWYNQQSRAAILRLGAKQDGIIRNHKVLKDGSYRDTVIFSIIESEWLACKSHLEHKMKLQ